MQAPAGQAALVPAQGGESGGRVARCTRAASSVGRDVHQDDRGSTLEDGVGNGVNDMSPDISRTTSWRLSGRNVQRGVHRGAGIQQLEEVLPRARVATPAGLGRSVRRGATPAGDARRAAIDVQPGLYGACARNAPGPKIFQPLKALLGVEPSSRIHEADDHVDAEIAQVVAILQECARLSRLPGRIPGRVQTQAPPAHFLAARRPGAGLMCHFTRPKEVRIITTQGPTPDFQAVSMRTGAWSIPPAAGAGSCVRLNPPILKQTNVEYVEFWLMDPFNSDAEPDNAGKLYINLGDISEDILKDSRKFFENGLPTSALVTDVDTTMWGRVPTLQNLVESFDNNTASRPFQDVGYDGLRDDDERTFLRRVPYVGEIQSKFGIGSLAYANALQDPSGDNYHYFRGSDYDGDEKYSSILERYKKYNGPDGNSPTDDQNEEDYPTSATTIPNVEDLNRDNTLSEAERYFQYMIDLDPNKMNVGENYITDIRVAQGIPLANGTTGEVNWYQFKVPVAQPSRVVGNISDFKSIRFMRMFVRGFEKPVVLRFATLELVRGEWRRYKGDLLSPGEYIPDDIQSLTTFDIFSVNIEENGRRTPIPYVIPPGIEQEQNIGTTTLVRLNEQSMVLKVCDLLDGDSRGGI